MTSKPGRPNSKHLDHILPRNQGGTHTHGNVRIICFTCNVRRPKDGRDYAGTFSLWAQGPVPKPETCPAGQHPWTAADNGKRRCEACREDVARKAVQMNGSGWVEPSWDMALAEWARRHHAA